MKQLIKFIPITVLILGLTPLIWFIGKGDILLNGVDTNFPLDPWLWFQRRLFIWNNVSNAGLDFSSSTAGLFFHLIQVIPYKFGFTLQLVEVISLVFWFTLICFSANFYARIILPGNRLAQTLFVVFYAFNTYIFNTWENVKVSNLALIAALPLGLVILTQLKQKLINFRKALPLILGTAIVLSGAGINPAYFFTFYLVLFIFTLGQILVDRSKTAIFESFKNFLLVGFIIFILNLFWILPTIVFLTGSISPIGSINKLGFTNWVDSLSENTSLLNVLRLQGAWDWYTVDEKTGTPIYIPYALNYFYNLPFIIFSFLLPLLSFLSFLKIDQEKKNLYISFGLMILLGVFLGTGTHLPTGSVYRTLAEHVPFFSIFRSPWYIFTPLVTISYAALISLFFYNLGKVKVTSKYRWFKLGLSLSMVVLIVGNLVYSYPLVTGKIFRPGRNDGFYIQFPQYVFDAKYWFDIQNNGRVIVYPDDEIENFKWGYRGIESILSLTTNQELLYSSLNTPDAPIVKLVRTFNGNLKKGQIDSADNLAKKLNIGMIFEKKDQDSLSPNLPSQAISAPITNFGPWNVYKFPQNDFLSKLYSPKNLYYGYPYTDADTYLGVLDSSSVLVSPDDNFVRKIPNIANIKGDLILTENSQLSQFKSFNNVASNIKDRLDSHDLSKVNFKFSVLGENDFKPILERYHLEDFGLNVSKGSQFSLELDGQKVSWEIERETDSYIYFKSVHLNEGEHIITLSLDNKNLISGGDFEGQIGYVQIGKGTLTLERNETGSYLSILNKGTTAPEPSADFFVSQFDPQSHYFISFKYQQIYGNNASVIVYQENQNTLIKAQTERLPNYPLMNSFNFFYEPVRTPSRLKVSLISPFIVDPLGTKVFYDDLVVYKVFSNNLVLQQVNSENLLVKAEINFKRISPVLYEADIKKAAGPHIIVFSENYSPDWDATFYTLGGEKIDVSPIHFSANFYANAWYVQGVQESYKLRIFYKRQNLMYLGFIIAGLTILGASWYVWGRSEKDRAVG